MKVIKIIITLIMAATLDLLVNSSSLLPYLPIFTAVLIFWLWQLSFSTRMLAAAAAGIFMDSLSIFPFGTHILGFFGLSLMVELLQNFFSDTRSLLTRSISFAILLFLFMTTLTRVGQWLA